MNLLKIIATSLSCFLIIKPKYYTDRIRRVVDWVLQDPLPQNLLLHLHLLHQGVVVQIRKEIQKKNFPAVLAVNLLDLQEIIVNQGDQPKIGPHWVTIQRIHLNEVE